MGRTKLAATLDRGSTIYGSLAGTYLGQRLLSVARRSPGFSRTLHYVIKDDRSSWTRGIRNKARDCTRDVVDARCKRRTLR